MESSNQEDYEAKDKAFYSAMISAWLNTKFERDKQLLGLSATAIGLLVTLLRTTGVSNVSQIILFAAALLAFLIAVVSVICIFDKNAQHIEKVLANGQTESKILMFLDNTAQFSFVVGMVIVIIIGIHSATINLNEKGENMNQNKPSDTSSRSQERQDSWNTVNKLRPQPPKPKPEQPVEPSPKLQNPPLPEAKNSSNTGS